MKQHITPKQLDELSEKGLNKLEEYRLGKDWQVNSRQYNEKMLLSIGDMIEFLDERQNSMFTKGVKGNYGEPVRSFEWKIGQTTYFDMLPNHEPPHIKEHETLYTITLHGPEDEDIEVIKEIENVELCDSLWESVKEVIEK